MMARRSSDVMADHDPISASVRMQPTQIPSAGCMTQIFTQGLSISSRRQTSPRGQALPSGQSPLGPSLTACLPPQMRQTIQRALQDKSGGHMVDHLGATFARRIRLKQRTLGSNG